MQIVSFRVDLHVMSMSILRKKKKKKNNNNKKNIIITNTYLYNFDPL